MEKDSAPLSPVLFSCTGQIDEKRTSFLVMSMPQQCCLHSRSSSRRVDLPPRRRRRTFFVTPRPDTGDIIDDKGNTTCPPNCSPSSDVINVCPPPVSHLRCYWWRWWWHAAKDVSPLLSSSELGTPTSVRDYDPPCSSSHWLLFFHYDCPHYCHHHHMRPPPLTTMREGKGSPQQLHLPHPAQCKPTSRNSKQRCTTL